MIKNQLFRTRTRDGVNVFVMSSLSYMDKTTHKWISEIPEGQSENDYYMSFASRIRCDQTGVIYEIAHDVEDAPFTYTEVFPDPADISEYENGQYPRYYNYPSYKAATVYHEGDIVVYSGVSRKATYICEVEGLEGSSPEEYGWEEYLPYIEEREPHYKSLRELYPEDFEDAV